MTLTTNALSYLKDPSKTLPMLLIEAPTTAGRTIQGYKRGGKTEGRERLCEETLGGIFWLFGIKAFNKIGDFIGEKVLGLKDLGVDVGKDSLRNPAGYIQDKKALTAAYKFSKIAGSAMLGILTMGLVVPKIKIAMTNAMRENAGLEPYPDKNSPDGKYHKGLADKFVSLFIKPKNKNKPLNEDKIITMDKFLASSKSANALSFKGNPLLNGVLYASHNLENNTAWRLLSTDFGTLAGRVANSRSRKERIEYATRDSISSVSYIFAAPIFSKLLSNLTKTPDIHPKASVAVCDYLKEIVQKEGALENGDLSGQILSKAELENLIKNINFTKDKTITLEDFNAQTGFKFANKAKLMSELQPEYINAQGVKNSILSSRQAADTMSNSYLSDLVFLKNAISKTTNGKSDDVRGFISRKQLERIRDSFDDFVLNLEKYALKKTNDGKITEDVIEKYTKNLNTKNFLIHMAGIAFAVVNLAILIPKFQYWLSEKLTGQKEFLGDLNMENNKSA